jgi:hypothetical protein
VAIVITFIFTLLLNTVARTSENTADDLLAQQNSPFMDTSKLSSINIILFLMYTNLVVSISTDVLAPQAGSRSLRTHM